MQKKETIDPRIVAKNQKDAKNAIKSMSNSNQQEIAKLKKEIKKLASDGKVNAAYDKFKSAIARFPTIGKYKWCKGCEADAPIIDGECAICGQSHK